MPVFYFFQSLPTAITFLKNLTISAWNYYISSYWSFSL